MRAEDAWNKTSIELSRAAMAHIRYFVIWENARIFLTTKLSVPVKTVLRQLFDLMAISWIFKHAGDFMTHAKLNVNIYISIYS